MKLTQRLPRLFCTQAAETIEVYEFCKLLPMPGDHPQRVLGRGCVGLDDLSSGLSAVLAQSLPMILHRFSLCNTFGGSRFWNLGLENWPAHTAGSCIWTKTNIHFVPIWFDLSAVLPCDIYEEVLLVLKTHQIYRSILTSPCPRSCRTSSKSC